MIIEEYSQKLDKLMESLDNKFDNEEIMTIYHCLRAETYSYKARLGKYEQVLDKIKEYCNHKLEMLELQKRNIMQILTPENGYLKTDIEIEMQKYKDILELLEEIE